VAIKEVHPTAAIKYVSGEIQMLSSVRHPNIIALYGICICDQGIFIITELSAGGNLRCHLKSHPDTPLVMRLKYLKETAAAMQYVSGRGILHRDLKADNLLVMNDGNIKLCDFGLARSTTKEGTDYTANVGTMEYVAPEILNQSPYDNSVDVFSFGVLMYELLARTQPPKRRPLLNFAFPEVSCPAEVPAELWQLMIKCTSLVPAERPTFQDILSIITKHFSMVSSPRSASALPSPSPCVEEERERERETHTLPEAAQTTTTQSTSISTTNRGTTPAPRRTTTSPTTTTTTTRPLARPPVSVESRARDRTGIQPPKWLRGKAPSSDDLRDRPSIKLHPSPSSPVSASSPTPQPVRPRCTTTPKATTKTSTTTAQCNIIKKMTPTPHVYREGVLKGK